MAPNMDKPANRGGLVCGFPGRNSQTSNNTEATRIQFLRNRCGLPFNRASLIAHLAWGEAA